MRGVWSALAGLLAAVLAALPAAATDMRSVVDEAGRHVVVPLRPQRIVSLAPNVTEILFAVGAGDRVVGVTDFCDYPPEARSRERVGGVMNFSLEKVLALRPDLAVGTTDGNHRDRVEALARLGVPVVVIGSGGVAGILQSIHHVGDLAGERAAAGALVAHLHARMEAVAAAVRARPRVRTLLLIWSAPPIAVNHRSFLHDLLERAGGINVTADHRAQYPRVSDEEVVRRAPDVIVIATENVRGGQDRGRVTRWTTVPAVKAGRIVVLPHPIGRPGPRVAEGLEMLARALHPEAFAPFQEDEVRAPAR